jgi:hypothetical protein
MTTKLAPALYWEALAGHRAVEVARVMLEKAQAELAEAEQARARVAARIHRRYPTVLQGVDYRWDDATTSLVQVGPSANILATRAGNEPR